MTTMMTGAGMTLKRNDELTMRSHLDVRISDLVAHCEMLHVFENRSDEPVEAVFTFPLPLEAAFLDMTAKIGGELVKAEIQPRQQAEQDYDDAIAEGDSGALLTMVEPGLLNLSLGNLLPGEEGRITLEYALVLDMAGQVARFSLPLVQRPRYGLWQAQDVEVPHNDLAHEHPLSVRIEATGLLAGPALQAVQCHSAAARVEHYEGRVVVSCDSAMMDRDLVLGFELKGALTSSGWLFRGEDSDIAAVTLVAPMPEQGSKNTRIDVSLLLDGSGSMTGDAIAQSRRAVEVVLEQLDDQDRIQIMRFGSAHKNLLRRPMRATPRVKKTLSDLIPSIQADLGGTEMGSALMSAVEQLASLTQAGREQSIVLVTDGAIHPDDVRDATKKAVDAGVRVFVVAVGSSAGVEALQPLADETGGHLERAVPTEPIDQCVHRQFQRSRLAKLQSVEIDWPAAPLEVLPSPEVYPGDAVTLMARLPSAEETSDNTAAIRISEVEQERTVPLVFRPADRAWQVLYGMQRYEAVAGEKRKTVALEYGLLVEETAAVLVKLRAENEKGQVLPRVEIMPHMMPAGMLGRVCYSEALPPLCFKDVEHLEMDAGFIDEMESFGRESADTSVLQSAEHVSEERHPGLERGQVLLELVCILFDRVDEGAGWHVALHRLIDDLPVELQGTATMLCTKLGLNDENGAVRLLEAVLGIPECKNWLESKGCNVLQAESMLTAHAGAGILVLDKALVEDLSKAAA